MELQVKNAITEILPEVIVRVLEQLRKENTLYVTPTTATAQNQMSDTELYEKMNSTASGAAKDKGKNNSKAKKQTANEQAGSPSNRPQAKQPSNA